jgi:predicted dehydrogenase
MRRLKIGIIGAGAMANTYHCPSLASFDDVEVVAVCDPAGEMANGTANRFGIPRVFADAKQMLAEANPDAVYVLVPPQFFVPIVTEALRRGKHVFLEKPPGVTSGHTAAMAYHAGRAGTCTMVGFQRRFIPAMTELRARVEARGPVQQVAVSYLKSTPNPQQPAWFWDGAVDILTSDGSHAVDNLRFLAGGDVVGVSSVARQHLHPGPLPDTYHALVTFSTGAVGTLHFSYTTGRRIFRAEIHGPNVTACVDADREAYIVAENGEPEVVASSSFGKPDRPETWLGFWHESRHFVDCVRDGRQPANTLADAVKTMLLIERIRNAAAEANPQHT